MLYLLAKFTILFILAALFGFILGRWLTRRSFVDVSESYEALQNGAKRADHARWDKLWRRFDEIPAPDLSKISDRLDALAYAVGNLPEPTSVDMMPVETKLDEVCARIGNIPIPVARKDVDLQPIIEKIANLEAAIAAIPAPIKPEPTNLAPVSKQIDGIESLVRRIPVSVPTPVDLRPVTSKLDGIDSVVRRIPAKEPELNLSPVQTELESIRKEIKLMPVVETHDPVDIVPIRAQLSALEQKIGAIPQPQAVNLAPVNQRLGAIEAELSGLGRRLTATGKPEGSSIQKRRKEPTILKAALYGEKDNLRLISGVGPKLERLLNRNGVYYYWQVATWTKRDIDIMDERLDTFKGRIGRDNWVSQAKKLKRSPDAAREPSLEPVADVCSSGGIGESTSEELTR